MPTSPVREPDSVMPNTVSAISASAAARRIRVRPSGPISTSGTSATADHSSSVARWLGWRMLPTARPAMPERAIHSPSARSGANTCSSAMRLLRRPAATQAAKKAASKAGVGRSAAPASAIAIVASSSPAADRLMAQGSTPNVLDSRAAAATKASAVCSAPVRAATARNSRVQAGAMLAIAKAPQAHRRGLVEQRWRRWYVVGDQARQQCRGPQEHGRQRRPSATHEGARCAHIAASGLLVWSLGG